MSIPEGPYFVNRTWDVTTDPAFAIPTHDPLIEPISLWQEGDPEVPEEIKKAFPQRRLVHVGQNSYEFCFATGMLEHYFQTQGLHHILDLGFFIQRDSNSTTSQDQWNRAITTLEESDQLEDFLKSNQNILPLVLTFQKRHFSRPGGAMVHSLNNKEICNQTPGPSTEPMMHIWESKQGCILIYPKKQLQDQWSNFQQAGTEILRLCQDVKERMDPLQICELKRSYDVFSTRLLPELNKAIAASPSVAQLSDFETNVTLLSTECAEQFRQTRIEVLTHDPYRSAIQNRSQSLIKERSAWTNSDSEVPQEIKQQFPERRLISADGNCFYSSFLAGYLEHLLATRSLDHFIRLHAKAEKDSNRSLHQELSRKLLSLIKNPTELDTFLLSNANTLPLVHLIRTLTAETISEDQDTYAPFIEEDFANFVKSKVLHMGSFADNLSIQALSKHLNVSVMIHSVHGKTLMPDPDNTETTPMMHLWLSGEHYSIIYPHAATSSTTSTEQIASHNTSIPTIPASFVTIIPIIPIPEGTQVYIRYRANAQAAWNPPQMLEKNPYNSYSHSNPLGLEHCEYQVLTKRNDQTVYTKRSEGTLTQLGQRKTAMI